MDRFFGRHPEVALLDTLCESGRAEFLAIYGRRRVGKTYLVREYFRDKSVIYFEFAGEKDAPLAAQLHRFQEKLETTFYQGMPIPRLTSWAGAFKTLAAALRATLQSRGASRAVIFLDELPWMAAPKSRLIQALDHIWNSELSTLPEVILVVCGSAASWIIDNLINAKGGLHNRITRQIHLMPFTLPETIEFLKARRIKLGMRATLELYMALGGVPHYLHQLDRKLSASQDIAALCFSENGMLRTEFPRLFRALFGESTAYDKIVRALAAKRAGVGRNALLSAIGAESEEA